MSVVQPAAQAVVVVEVVAVVGEEVVQQQVLAQPHYLMEEGSGVYPHSYLMAHTVRQMNFGIVFDITRW